MNVTHYKQLIVWQKGMMLVNEIYSITKEFPKNELYGLSSHMQRAAVAIPANIAEGQARNHIKEYIQFLGIAYASSAELETELMIAKAQYSAIDYSTSENLLIEVQKMLNSMIRNLKLKPVSAST
jgi:four helix bundle protein